MHAIEEAAREVGIGTEKLWTAVAPTATVTSEALKQSPKRLSVCRRLGSIFRNDVANLQSLLQGLGAKHAAGTEPTIDQAAAAGGAPPSLLSA